MENRLIKYCTDCGKEIITYISDNTPIVDVDCEVGVFVQCPHCGEMVQVIAMPDIDPNIENDLDFIIEDYKYDLNSIKEEIDEIERGIKRLDDLKSKFTEYQFILNKLMKIDK